MEIDIIIGQNCEICTKDITWLTLAFNNESLLLLSTLNALPMFYHMYM